MKINSESFKNIYYTIEGYGTGRLHEDFYDKDYIHIPWVFESFHGDTPFDITFSFVKNEYISEIIDFNDTLKNFKLRLYFQSTNDRKQFERALERSVNDNGVPFAIHDNEKFINIIGFEYDTLADTYIFNLEENYNDENFDSSRHIRLYNLLGSTNPINISSENIEESDEDLTILHGHRKDGFEDEFTTEIKKKKSYKDVKELESLINNFEYSNVEDEVKIDYSEFENHIFFGSAFSKVRGVQKKMYKIDGLEGFASTDKKQEINEIIDNFSPYEKYVYNEIWKNKNLQEFDEWIDNQEKEAEEYDSTNNNFLLYSVPEYFLSEDDENLFTNLLLLIGEFMDSQYSYIKAFENLYNFDITSSSMVSEKFIDTLLADFGFDIDYKYTDKDFETFFNDENNLKRISNELSKRLLYTLPFLIKAKGTNKIVEYILNTFGIPADLIQTYEFGAIDRDDDMIRYTENYDWFVHVPENDSFNMVINDSDVDFDEFTTQFAIKELTGSSGKIIEYNATNYIGYEVNSNDKYIIQIVQDGTTVYTSPEIFNNDLWNFITVRKDGLDGNIVVHTLNTVENNIVGRFEEDFFFQSGGLTFTDIDIFSEGGGDITEYRVFNSVLSDDVVDYHSRDIRSVAEENNEDNLVFRFKFYKPDSDPVEIESSDDKGFILTSSIDRVNFKKDSFFLVSLTNVTITNMLSSPKIGMFEREVDGELSSKRTSSSFKNVDGIIDFPFYGLFVSPTDFYNEYLIRKVGYDTEFIIDDNTENDFSFSNLEEIKQFESRIEYDFFKESVIYKILDLFNNKVYNVLKEFLPASSKLLTGLLIKNTILDKNKTFRRKDTLIHDPEPTPKFKRAPLATDFVANKINFTLEGKRVIISDAEEQIESLIDRPFTGERSRYILPIETFTDTFKRSPWFKRLIKGNSDATQTLSAEEIAELFNQGARILVK